MCDRITDKSSTLEDIDTDEFVESLKNKNSNIFRSQDSYVVASHIRGFSSSRRNSCDGTRQITHNHFYHSKKHNGDKYEPHTKAKQNRADPFSSDEIQMLYCRAKLGACKLSNCALIFIIYKSFTVH